MATDKPRFSVSFTVDSYNKIKQFQGENKISTQSKAVSQLVELALDEADKAASLSDVRYSGEEVFGRVRGRIHDPKAL